MIKNLIKVQVELKAPKDKRNDFGKYNYRNAEDILEAAKPLLDMYGLLLYFDEDVEEISGRTFLTSIAHLTDGNEEIVIKGRAEMDTAKKGMDLAQITGSCSSYAKKYALGNLFLIDESRDADATNDGKNNSYEAEVEKAIATINAFATYDELKAYWTTCKKAIKDDQRVYSACETACKRLKIEK